MSEWISVEDRLPESIDSSCWSIPVIALCDARLVYKLSYFKGYGDDEGAWQRSKSFADNASKNVTHWMPLPSPPEAK